MYKYIHYVYLSYSTIDMSSVTISLSIPETYAKNFSSTTEMEQAMKYFLDSYIEAKHDSKLRDQIANDAQLDALIYQVDKKL